MKKRTKKMMWLLAALVAVVIMVLVCNLSVTSYSSGKTYSDAAIIPERKVGLVLGTSPFLKDGRANPYFFNRIEATVQLYNSGKISYILVSGDNRRHDYNEPEAMKNALVKKGVPEEKIFLDYAGLRTLALGSEGCKDIRPE